MNKWTVLAHHAFDEWLNEQDVEVQDAILAHLGVLAEYGPALGRPYADTLKGATLTNLKELRVQHHGNPWRVLFAFDRKRRAVVLLGGNKRGDKRWYQNNIPIAEKRFDEHLRAMDQEEE